MMNRRRFLLIHNADPKAFARKHGLEPFTAPCQDCGAERETSIPFVAGQLRGLIAPLCSCGCDKPPYCVIHATGDLTELFEEGARTWG